MSLFDKNQLLEFLDDTYTNAIAQDKSHFTALKLTRRAYKDWIEEFTGSLKEQIKQNEALDPAKKEYRVKRQAYDFHFFRKTYFPHYYTLKGKSKLQEHLEDVYKKLIDKNKPMGLKFAIAAPRGFGKSTDVSVVFVIWCIVNNYKHFIPIFSDAVELAETLVESIKAELQDNQNLISDFKEATGVGKSWKVGDFISVNNVKVKAYGSGKRARGVKHGTYRPDLVIIDDLENDTNVRSRKQRDKTEEWLDEAIDNLGSVDGSMDILYIGTILHKDSVLARKLKLKFWHPVIFKALSSYPANMPLWEEFSKIYKYQGVEDARNYYLEHKADMDEGAVLLWDSVSLLYLMQKRATNPRAFQKEQQNSPNSENQKFDSAKFKKISPTLMPKLHRVFCFMDVKGDSEAKDSDYFAVVVGGVNDETQKLYIFYSYHSRLRGKAAINKGLEIVQSTKIDILGGDKNGGFHYYRDFLKSEAWHKNIKLPFLKFTHHTDNKLDKMGLLEFPIEDEDMVFVGEHPELFKEMDDFPESEHDDLHDALYGVYDLSKLSRYKRNTNKRTKYKAKRYKRQRGR